ncbi:hypothetical protein Pint_12471 [Pistacia integerrima]|uniref:Uncharacterized protein n=1 Tax=Pistacia integerrima TaxID=434235 RepID=A0ACC0Y864_9ROSI|nr:hypothetical protein Pint_12471 [Pistacia integerrima]
MESMASVFAERNDLFMAKELFADVKCLNLWANVTDIRLICSAIATFFKVKEMGKQLLDNSVQAS